jgi:hypothetical protein
MTDVQVDIWKWSLDVSKWFSTRALRNWESLYTVRSYKHALAQRCNVYS